MIGQWEVMAWLANWAFSYVRKHGRKIYEVRPLLPFVHELCLLAMELNSHVCSKWWYLLSLHLHFLYFWLRSVLLVCLLLGAVLGAWANIMKFSSFAIMKGPSSWTFCTKLRIIDYTKSRKAKRETPVYGGSQGQLLWEVEKVFQLVKCSAPPYQKNFRENRPERR